MDSGGIKMGTSIKDVLECLSEQQKETLEKRTKNKQKQRQLTEHETNEQKKRRIANMSDSERWAYYMAERGLKKALKDAKEFYHYGKLPKEGYQ